MRAVALSLCLCSSAVTAGDFSLHDLHLPVTDRTEEERARIAIVTTPTQDFSAPEAFENNPGGAATVAMRTDHSAFSQPSANIGPVAGLDFELGNALFEKLWVSSPSSTQASDGLGPVYNARSCQRCHLNDGRGHPPENADDSRVSMFLRLSMPAPDTAPMTEIETYLNSIGIDTPRTRPEPTYGTSCRISPCRVTIRRPGSP